MISTTAPVEIAIDFDPFTVVRSCRTDQVVMEVGRHLRPHRMRTLSPEGLNTVMQYVPMGNMAMGKLRYGGRVEIDSEPLVECYIVSVPLAGAASYRQGGSSAVATPREIIVLGPTERFTIDSDRDYEQIFVRVGVQTVDRVHKALFGVPPHRPVEFPLESDPVAAASVLPVFQLLLGNDRLLANIRSSPRLITHVEWLLISSLLRLPGGSTSSMLQARDEETVPDTVRRAERFIHEHLTDSIDIADIAKAAHTSPRSLFSAFKTARQTTPMALVRHLRLERVQEELEQANPESATVTEVAMRWGFSHLGEFSRAYGSRFGERPSVTLRRAPRSIPIVDLRNTVSHEPRRS